jgi:hypothetical protein
LNAWVVGDIQEAGDGTYTGKLLDDQGDPTGDEIADIVPLSNLDPPSGGFAGFRPIYVDKVNGNDANDGFTTARACKTWSKCLAILEKLSGAVITLTGFTDSDSLLIDGVQAYGKNIVIAGDIEVNHIIFSDLASVRFLGEVTANHVVFSDVGRVLFSSPVTIASGADASEVSALSFVNSEASFASTVVIDQHSYGIEARNSRVYFGDSTVATATDSSYGVTFVEVHSVSIIRFKEFTITNTAGNVGTVQYMIEDGCEVYVGPYRQ